MQRVTFCVRFTRYRVSVSTSGSKGVQPAFFLVMFDLLSCFSIHKRIEGGATRRRQPAAATSTTFQYPQADRRGCNETFLQNAVGGWAFQYPQADRRGCNQQLRCAAVADIMVSVSTSGSKGVQHLRLAFQPPPLSVSVSTSGSKGVQHK